MKIQRLLYCLLILSILGCLTRRQKSPKPKRKFIRVSATFIDSNDNLDVNKDDINNYIIKAQCRSGKEAQLSSAAGQAILYADDRCQFRLESFEVKDTKYTRSNQTSYDFVNKATSFKSESNDTIYIKATNLPEVIGKSTKENRITYTPTTPTDDP